MNYILRNLATTDEYKKIKNKNYPLEISGIVDVAKTALISLSEEETKEKICIITYNEIQAQKLVKDIKYFLTDSDDVLFFPKRELGLYDYDVESTDITSIRANILNQIYKGKAKVIVTTIEAIMQSMIPKKSYFENIIELKNGDVLDLESFKQKLVLLGYERSDLVEGKMQFSVRGDIVDISLTENEGLRVELWGDEIDSIRKFNLLSQRTTEMLKEATIFPADEKILEVSKDVVCERIRNVYENLSKSKQKYLSEIKYDLSKQVEEDLEEIQNGSYKANIDKYFNEFYEASNFLDYLDGFEIWIDEPSKIEDRKNAIKTDNENLIKELMEREKFIPEVIFNMQNFDEKIRASVSLENEDSQANNMRMREITVSEDNPAELKNEVEYAKKEKRKTVILAGTEENQNRLKKIIPDAIKVENLDSILVKEGQVVISTGSTSTGFEDKLTNLLVISDEDFGTTKKKRRRANSTFTSSAKIVFADLKVNDYVVHRNYGIGIFEGVKSIEYDGIRKDYIMIKYRNSDTLYVPTTDLDNVRKYVGDENGIRLNKLGTKEWKETKERVKGNLRAVAKELIELYAKREHTKGYAFSKDTPWQKEFEDSFPYQETDDQLRCIKEVKQDMESSRPMDRLLCGDVGYGKTEVAIRAAFKAVMDSKQVCYLAPTTILANQQYEEFKERMKAYPIKIELLNRFRTAKEQKEVVKRLKTGDVDIVIGTHRVLSKDVEFKNLGLLIVDEEQRFGVKAKEKIKEYKANIDVLTMTATPIPRTLQLSVVGIRDMSVIYEPPQNRKPIQTYVMEYDKEVIKEAITKEIERKGQVFYIFNNVERIQEKANEIARLVPEAKVSFAHGKMGGKEIEDIMQEFIDGKTNVLVCTTILESGIDIPNANTIIIENADRFGLAQLYQIRGRVGRSNKQAYAYITYRKDKMISEDATQRLKAIKEFTEFGSGFKIATRDLQIRGAGSLFGEIQSGHMEQVGYDTYTKLLNEVIKESEGKIDVNEDLYEEITIDINLNAYIPDSYISDSSQKIEIYQDIASSNSEEDISNVIDELIDRYGELPKEVENLLEIARFKMLCKKAHIVKVMERPMGIVFTFNEKGVKVLTNGAKNEKMNPENENKTLIELLMRKYGSKIRISGSEKPYITLRINDKENEVGEIKSFVNDLIQ